MRNFVVCISLFFTVTISGCRKDHFVHNDKVSPNNFLSNTKYDKLIVEIQYVKGFPPTAAAIHNLLGFLQEHVNKSSGISIVQSEIASPGKSFYTLSDIENIERANRTQNTARKTLTAYLFFADNDYVANNGNSKVLGIAYGNSSMVIFEKTIRDFSGGIMQPPVATLETTVMDHEFGHLFGLVNNGTPMQVPHQDAPYGMHCNNKDCLMYYTAETSDIISNIVGGNIPALDGNCIDDLRANGGK